ncbi:PAS domain S-box protein [Geomonas sp. RF6]|uniref:PAS domain-containing hybrid sensor histidine kinase/response regulator n=1 Tax=Geomonas sp. RF6 TaxID=2897342 RepID=UPI001E62A8DC|nr:PAS domain-containing sensor histidine kinase [Geomonas sp. RF6]UFS70345.1 PAS domain S-box protein [Geomonas sp. RF6]
MVNESLDPSEDNGTSRACCMVSSLDLANSCRLIDHILAQTPNPTWISDRSGTLIRINRACLQLLNVTEDDVVGKYNVLQDNLVREQGFLPLVERVFELGETARFEIRYDSSRVEHLQLEKHARVTLDVTIFAVNDEGGIVTNAVIQHIDITARRESEEALERANAELEARVEARTAELAAAHRALRDSEELFRTLCAAAPIGIFMTGADGNCIYANPRLRDLLGAGAEDAQGVSWSGILYPEDRERILSSWSTAVAAGAPFEHEFQIPNGQRPVWVRGLAHPYFSPGGGVAGYVGIIDDITEQRQAREEMLRTQKLESLGVLAGGIAHDFNNVLTIILGYVSLARSRTSEVEVVEHLRESERGIVRARGLTQQLLTFARGGKPVRKTVLLNDLLHDAVTFAALGSNVRCDFRLAPEKLLLQADEGQLGQVVHNLVLNAIQAMPEGGSVTVESLRSLTASGEPTVSFSIRDTGTGIAENIRSKIFDPYFSTKKGSGLGLTSCYSIIKNHDGKIRVDSVPGLGTSFTVTLPACPPQPSPEPVTLSNGQTGCGRILLMDDEPLIREVGQALLEQLGYRVDVVADGEAALVAYRRSLRESSRYAAVIMDLTVPGGMGGKEVVSALLLEDPAVKAVVSSGYADDPVMAEFREYGFSGVLVKPYSADDLSHVISAVVGSAET